MENKQSVIFISGREVNYPRNDLLINALKNSFDLTIIGPKKKIISRGNFLQIIFNSIKGFLLGIYQLIIRETSFIFIGFFGQFLINSISMFTQKPIIFDFFISTWDTLVNDRNLIKKNSILSRLLFRLDSLSCKNADMILVDTISNREFFQNKLNISEEKIKVLHIGCNERIFQPRNIKTDDNLVLYYSTYMPLHGVDVIVKAAHLLSKTTPLKFRIIGDGMEYKKIRILANSLNVRNIEFIPTIPLEHLPQEIAKASICLGGHFGSSDKARRVIAGKTVQMLAMAKPTIVGNNNANREILTHKKDALFCEMNDAEALADAIKFLHKNRTVREKLGREAYMTYKKNFSFKVLQKELQSYIDHFFSP
jgi:glycosyltransferase involved in cell wall biosynthesis